jgi:hypothetical protein
MKNHKNTPQNLLLNIALVGLLSLLLTSCLKTDNSNNYTPVTTALLSFVQASPDQPPLDFYIGNGKVNPTPLNYGNSLSYFTVPSGQIPVNFLTNATGSGIVSGTVNLNQNAAYSLFLANKTTSPEIVLLTDTITMPTVGNASIRFINLSPDSQPVSLAVQGNTQPLTTAEPYKGYTSFFAIKGKTPYTLEVLQGTTVLATLPNVTFLTGGVYTVWFNGLVASTNSTDKLGIGIFTNTYFN